MRMWCVDPRLMCRKHLLGEHVELHMLVGSIQRGKSLDGFLKKGLLDLSRIHERHAELVAEMSLRGYNHNSPLDVCDVFAYEIVSVDSDASLAELARRCADCRDRQKKGTTDESR